MLIDSGDIDILNISRIDIVVGGDHGQGAFRFPMKILYIMKNLSEDVIISKFGEYNYHHETGFKPDLVIF